MSATFTRGDFLRLGATAAGAALSAGAPALAQSPSLPTRSGFRFDARPFESWIVDWFGPSVKLPGGVGNYARKAGEGLELYGVSDMASILYSLNRLSPSDTERAQWADAFQTFQRGGDGWLVERARSHDPLHNTAYALASMQLLDLRPRNPVTIKVAEDPAAFLETLDWQTNVYLDSHKGAGAGSIAYLVPELNKPAWFDAYFAKCDSLFDPRNGMMGRDKPVGGDFDQLGGTFHYGFLYETFHKAMPYPEARIDAIIGLQQADGYWHPTNHLWLTLDAIYMLTRTLRYTTHRFEDVRNVVRRTVSVLANDVYSVDGRVRSFNGALPTHSVMAAISILAEAQRFLGAEEILTERPLRLVLDRRPFI